MNPRVRPPGNDEAPAGPVRARPAPAGGVCAGGRQTTRLSSSTKTSPLTEITVSISDQDRIVWPTDSPKNSLTSQKPASLTCEKNSEPEPIASTSSDVSPVLRCVTRGARIPEV